LVVPGKDATGGAARGCPGWGEVDVAGCLHSHASRGTDPPSPHGRALGAREGDKGGCGGPGITRLGAKRATNAAPTSHWRYPANNLDK